MSTRVTLSFRESPHSKLTSAGIEVKVIRLVARVRFFNGVGWSDTKDAIVDTGSPLAVLPESIWKDLPRRLLLTKQMIGLGGREVMADVAELWAGVVDKENSSLPILLRAYLCYGDSELLLLGMEDVLTRCVLHCDHASKTAYLEFP